MCGDPKKKLSLTLVMVLMVDGLEQCDKFGITPKM